MKKRMLAVMTIVAPIVWGADDAKVLGFTMDAPAPEDSKLVGSPGTYKAYLKQHRWCGMLFAIADKNGVLAVICISPGNHEEWGMRLQVRHGDPVLDDRLGRLRSLPQGSDFLQLQKLRVWVTDGLGAIALNESGVGWFSSRIMPTPISAESSEAEVRESVTSTFAHMDRIGTSMLEAHVREASADEHF